MTLSSIIRLYRQSRINNFQNEVRSIYRTAEKQFLNDSMLLESGKKILYTNCDSCTPTGVDEVKELDMTGNTDFKYYVLINIDGKVLNVRATNGTYSYSLQAEDADHPIQIEDIDVENNNSLVLDSDLGSEICLESEGLYVYNPTSKYIFKYVTRKQPNLLSYGDEVAIGSEHFYAIAADENQITLLSK